MPNVNDDNTKRFSPPGTKPKPNRKDKNRRRRWLDLVNRSKVSRGCRAWLLQLILKSDDAVSKVVFGRQTGQAKLLGCSDRTIRRYRKEAEDAGMIKTLRYRYDPVQGSRFMTNRYHFNVPAPTTNRAKRQVKASGHLCPVKQHPSDVYKTLEIQKYLERPPIPKFGPSEPEPECSVDRKAAIKALRELVR